jgi:hypothetical protein
MVSLPGALIGAIDWRSSPIDVTGEVVGLGIGRSRGKIVRSWEFSLMLGGVLSQEIAW